MGFTLFVLPTMYLGIGQQVQYPEEENVPDGTER